MKKVLLFLTILTLLGGFLRFYYFTRNPVSLTIDEVAFGYNAYSILKSGKDEYGKFMPLSFKSTGDYKNPIPIYSMIPSIAFFGLNEFSIRFPTALLATLSIPLFYLFFMEITSSIKISLVATSLLTISPWYIYYSRYVSDHLIAAFLVILGTLLFFKMQRNGKWFWALGSAIFLILSMYTYYAERLFVPLLILLFVLTKRENLKQNKKALSIFIISSFILVLPIVFSNIFGPDRARAQMTWIGNDIEFTRNVAVKSLTEIPFFGSQNLLLFNFWARKYLNYFDPTFLFSNGLNMTSRGSYGLGVLYLFEIPWLILGIIALIKKKIKNKNLIILWILIGLLPASLTNNEQHPGRTFFILPMLLLISAYGAVEFFKIINFNSRILRNIIFASFLMFFVWNIAQMLLIYCVHFPRQRGEAFMEGTKESVEYALANKNKYTEIVFDPYRGIEAPYIVNIPHMYILFYSKYDPYTYQTENKIRSDGSFGFDKFTIRRIDWREDRLKKGTLFIGSPWSLPEKDLKADEILKRIYLSSGDLALVIVSPK